MSNLISRTPFLESTASLFTSEKIATARSKIIEWLNEASTSDVKGTVENILKCQELLIHSDVELLDEFLDNILTFSQKKAQEIRRCVIGFIEEVCKLQIQFLPRVITILSMFMRDESPQVKKRFIQACAAVYRNALKWICSSIEITDELENAWNALCLIKAQILDMIDNDNDGIRTNAIKFLEGVILLQTYPDEDSMKRENDFSLADIPLSLKIVRRRKLEDEALHIIDLLLKFHGASHISSVNLIACMGTICTVAKLRPTFMSSVLDALKSLNSNLPPTLTDSQVSSVKKHMRMQLLNILKLPAAFEYQAFIANILSDLGVSNQEIARTLPKLDKYEYQRRTKRALENANAISTAKKVKLDKEVIPEVPRSGLNILPIDRPMEIDTDELAEQRLKAIKLNEAFVTENLRAPEVAIKLVMTTMDNLPTECPDHFLINYHPISNLTIPNQTKRIAEMLAELMADRKLGPGAAAFTKDPPMRIKVTLDEEKMIIQSAKTVEPMEVVEEEELAVIDDKITEDDNELRKEEATKKLRETLERVKGEQSMIPKMKQRVKTLKLQEVTKPLPRNIKEQFLSDSVQRILKSERQCIIGGVSVKRRKILTVIAASFSTPVRDLILNFILEDLKSRIDLAFSWLYEEYSLFQGFTRHSYIKSEHKPDYAYNTLLNKILNNIMNMPDGKDKERLLKKIYLESPIISEDALNTLVGMCEFVELSNCGMELLKDLAIRRPPKQEKFLVVLLKFSMHQNIIIREKAIANVIIFYNDHKIKTELIEDFGLLWFKYLDKPTVPAAMFSSEFGRTDKVVVWTEDLAKVCLSLFLTLMPFNPKFVQNLSDVYTNTTSDMKRTILKSIEIPIRSLGSDCEELLNLIEKCPKGAETLVTRVVYILTERSEPTPHLVAKVRDLYQNKVPDVRLLIPVLSGLTKKEILTALPKFLKLNPVVVKEVFNRLLNLGSDNNKNVTMPITPVELLVALHVIDSKCELKFIVKATALCLQEKEIYTQDILAIVLQQLVEISPIPTLLMRTVIQSLSLYPRLSNFVASLLQRLVLKQVWKQKVIFDGFLKCCQRLQPHCLPILLQLPPPQLQDALKSCPELRAPMLSHAIIINEKQGHVPEQIMDILSGAESTIKVLTEIIPDETLSTKDAAEEVINEFQPLPPGEE